MLCAEAQRAYMQIKVSSHLPRHFLHLWLFGELSVPPSALWWERARTESKAFRSSVFISHPLSPAGKAHFPLFIKFWVLSHPPLLIYDPQTTNPLLFTLFTSLSPFPLLLLLHLWSSHHFHSLPLSSPSSSHPSCSENVPKKMSWCKNTLHFSKSSEPSSLYFIINSRRSLLLSDVGLTTPLQIYME